MADERPQEALQEFATRARDLPALRRLDAAAAEAFEAFDAAEVEALLLKGPALARLLYTDCEHRGYSDVDVLVAPRDLESARRVLAGLGYTDISKGLGVEDFAGDLHDESWARVGSSGEGGVLIDLHRQMPRAKAAPEPAWEVLRARRTWIELGGRPVPTLAVEGLAMHLAIHVAQHGKWYRRPLEDLDKGLERWSMEVWQGARSLAEQVGAAEAFAAGLRLSPRGAALALALGLPATDELQWEIEHDHARPRGTFHLMAFGQALTLRDRASIMRRSFLPTRNWIAWQYPWARQGRTSLAAAYGLHIMRAPVWALRAWRFQRRARRA